MKDIVDGSDFSINLQSLISNIHCLESANKPKGTTMEPMIPDDSSQTSNKSLKTEASQYQVQARAQSVPVLQQRLQTPISPFLKKPPSNWAQILQISMEENDMLRERVAQLQASLVELQDMLAQSQEWQKKQSLRRANKRSYSV